jgi:hypothetical protein
MRADQLAASTPADLHAYNATVAAPAPATGADELWVLASSFDGGTHKIGPCRWQAPTPLPSVGDECLLILADEDATPWVVAFDT